ncbi:MAG: sensor histidine kinase KdpD [Fimbriimonas sp.]|nr:sensor histidine kinase KdpD [Fimbriimonas sp.]
MPDSQTNSAKTGGRHKIFLSYAPGVGKTHAMLEEAHRRSKRGQDVVIGLVDPANRDPVSELAVGIEAIPPKVVNDSPELDVDAVIARKPGCVLVDDLEHTNAPGSVREKRWQDVQVLLDAGINVLSTVNVYHLESLNDNIADIIGTKIKDTIPDQILRDAAEVEYIDLTPRALMNRLDRGDLYDVDRVTPEVVSFFREGNLSALREIAMREAASCVDEDLVEYRKDKRIERPWATQDRVMICVSSTRSALRLIRRGWRMGQRMHGEVLAVHVENGPIGDRERKILADDFKLAERLGIQTFTLKGELAPTLIEFAKERNVTQLIIGHPQRNRFQEILRPAVLAELVKALRTVDILVVATESPSGEA